jgi:hypothetical protein
MFARVSLVAVISTVDEICQLIEPSTQVSLRFGQFGKALVSAFLKILVSNLKVDQVLHFVFVIPNFTTRATPCFYKQLRDSLQPLKSLFWSHQTLPADARDLYLSS